MKETGILFKQDMIKAIIEGRKTMTRRIVKMRDGSLMQEEDLSKHIDGSFDKVMDFTKTYPYWQELKCRLGSIGDLLYVKEAFAEFAGLEPANDIVYKADGIFDTPAKEHLTGNKWKSPLFMPKSAARIWSEILDIKAEKLQDISEEDAKAEGVIPFKQNFDDRDDCWSDGKYKTAYQFLWNEINGWQPNAWEANPFVFAISFKVLSTTGKPQ